MFRKAKRRFNKNHFLFHKISYRLRTIPLPLTFICSIFIPRLCVFMSLNVVGTTAMVMEAYSHGLLTLSELISLFLLCYCWRHELIQLQIRHTILSSPFMNTIHASFFMFSVVISFHFLEALFFLCDMEKYAT